MFILIVHIYITEIKCGQSELLFVEQLNTHHQNDLSFFIDDSTFSKYMYLLKVTSGAGFSTANFVRLVTSG